MRTLDGTWRKSTRSQQESCVEVRLCDGSVEVRDTKDSGMGPTLSFPPAAWQTFIEAAKRDDFTACRPPA